MQWSLDKVNSDELEAKEQTQLPLTHGVWPLKWCALPVKAGGCIEFMESTRQGIQGIQEDTGEVLLIKNVFTLCTSLNCGNCFLQLSSPCNWLSGG